MSRSKAGAVASGVEAQAEARGTADGRTQCSGALTARANAARSADLKMAWGFSVVAGCVKLRYFVRVDAAFVERRNLSPLDARAVREPGGRRSTAARSSAAAGQSRRSLSPVLA